ncbi:Uncharacterized mitochondrial protein AtMg00310 [Linum perenne]
MINKMNSKSRNFFWAGDQNKCSIHWSYADILCAHKASGGLGFRDFNSFNLVLAAKQAWRLSTLTDPLWVRVLKNRYFPGTTFSKARKGYRPYWIWASLCDARATLSLGTIRVIRNGESTLFTSDPWVPSLPSFTIDPTTHSNIRVLDFISINRRSWDQTKLLTHCTPAQLREIVKIPIGPQN